MICGSPYPPFFKFTKAIAKEYGFERLGKYKNKMSIYRNEERGIDVVFSDDRGVVVVTVLKDKCEVDEFYYDELTSKLGGREAVHEVFRRALSHARD